MTKQLTDSEKVAKQVAWESHQDQPFVTARMKRTNSGYIDFNAGFVAGLSYNQAKLDKLISLIEIYGELTRNEIEELL
jgi:hypothetical protein